MFVTCMIWCLADISSVSPSSEQTAQSYQKLSGRSWKTLTTFCLSSIAAIQESTAVDNSDSS